MLTDFRRKALFKSLSVHDWKSELKYSRKAPHVTPWRTDHMYPNELNLFIICTGPLIFFFDSSPCMFWVKNQCLELKTKLMFNIFIIIIIWRYMIDHRSYAHNWPNQKKTLVHVRVATLIILSKDYNMLWTRRLKLSLPSESLIKSHHYLLSYTGFLSVSLLF